MTFRKHLVRSVAALFAISTLSAFQAKPVDLTGVWSGTFTPTTGDGQTRLRFDLKQKGADLTGTAGPAGEPQLEIANGKVTTVKDVTSVAFDVTPPNGLILKFELKLIEGRLKGKVSRERDGQKQEAILDIGREK